MRPNPVPPSLGQESVWDYPRPPRLERVPRRIRIVVGGVDVVDTTEGRRVLETSHPPTWYVPFTAVRPDAELMRAGGTSVCEWKGRAAYWDVRAGDAIARDAAWSYPDPTPAFAGLAGCFTVYPGRVDACYVDDDLVEAQPGGFYGGWMTPEIVGPVKGGTGTWGW